MLQRGKHIEDISGGQIVLYQNNLEVKLMRDTVWLSLNQLAKLFEKDNSVISRHLRNIFGEHNSVFGQPMFCASTWWTVTPSMKSGLKRSLHQLQISVQSYNTKGRKA